MIGKNFCEEQKVCVIMSTLGPEIYIHVFIVLNYFTVLENKLSKS